MRHNIIDISQLFLNKRIRIYVFAISLAVFVFLFSLFFSEGQKIPTLANKLIVMGHNKLSSQEIINFLGIQPGVSFKNYDINNLEKILKGHPRIKSVSITRKSKDQLLISIVERRAKFIIRTKDHLHEIDDEFNVMSTNDIREFSIPVISGDISFQDDKIKNSVISEFITTISDSFEAYPSIHDRTSEILKNKDGEIFFYIHYPKPIKVQIGTTLDRKQIRKLYASLAYFENQNKEVNFLDLRGEDAVYH
ncbi:MAG: FtsQ-type POTRA domain-containing protein [Leptospiraceae bacterium]|nr:FtsQ-type POTRA domain-containing protein [Leptospiraceae bacterium]MCK6381468.1 FtsQ-type POTRA domain-containing protein [Leptospiraceae bacterium]NUM40183.1 FtsQ-type POTRA domain-containing protein [Leptospiraceae bacterium]